jgi:Myb-like DNA-binding domain
LHGVDPHDDMVELTPHGHHAQPQPMYSHGAPTSGQLPPPQVPQHHHHRLPNQPPPSKMRRLGYDDSPPQQRDHGPPSVVGQEGMPPPAPRPRGPKLKFTPDDDQLLVDLKEKKNLTWKQIADFFPGRSSGTLQVRYCTKLKAKTTVWTDELVSHPSSWLLTY